MIALLNVTSAVTPEFVGALNENFAAVDAIIAALEEQVSSRILTDLTIESGADSGIFSFEAGAAGTTGELLLKTNKAGLNVLALQNDSESGFSAITFRRATGREASAFGFGGPTAGDPWANTSYWEASYFPTSGTNVAPGMLMAQTGYNPGTLANGTFRRFEVRPLDEGNIKVYAQDGFLAMMNWQANGTAEMNATGTSAHVITARGHSADSYSAIRFMTAAGAEKGSLGYANASTAAYAGKFFLNYRASDSFIFGQDGIEAARLTPSLGFSVGTTTDPGKGALFVLADLSAGNALQIQNRVDGYSSAIFRSSAGAEKLVVGYANASAATYTGLAYLATPSSAPLILAQGGSERMRMTPSGGFSVGTTTDPGKGSLFVLADITGNAVTVQNKVDGYSSAIFKSSAGVEKLAVGYSNASAAVYTDLAYFATPATTPLIMAQGGAERMRMTASGGFSIGTTTDPGKGALFVLADVVGNAITVQNRVDGYSSVIFKSSAGAETLVVGYGNASAGAFTGLAYVTVPTSSPLVFAHGTTERMRMTASGGLAVGLTTDTPAGKVRVNDSYMVGANQVIGARDTGWTPMTGTLDKSTAYDTSSVTVEQLAGRLAALQASFTNHGLIGAS